MKISELKKTKTELFDNCYSRIIDDFECYEDINTNNMLKEIIRVYSDHNNIIALCTIKELKVLDLILNNKLTKKDKPTYACELNILKNKFLIDKNNLIYEDVLTTVKKALKQVNYKEKEKIEPIQISIIALVKIHMEIDFNYMKRTITKLHNIDNKEFDSIFHTPLVRFYVFQWDKELYNDGDYSDYIDELEYSKKSNRPNIYSLKEYTQEELKNIFYFGFDIDKPCLKELYKVSKTDNNISMYLNNVRIFNERKKFLDYIHKTYDGEKEIFLEEALDLLPCPCLHGNSYNDIQNNKLLIREKNIKNEIQKNACISKKRAKMFYKILISLFAIANNDYKVINKKFTKQGDLNYLEANVLLDVLWKHKSLVIKKYIAKYKPNKEELKLLKAIEKSEIKKYILVSFTEEYTELMGEDGKIYMIKGINCNIDELYNGIDLPICVSTALINYDNTIVYNSGLNLVNINDLNKLFDTFINNYENVDRVYHME